MARVLVTGANKGIGLAICKALVDRGVFVFLGSRSLERGVAAAATLSSAERVEVVQIDVTDDRSVEAAAQTVKARCDADGAPLTGLVNNAGVCRDFVYTNHDDFEFTLAANWQGLVRTTTAFAPLLGDNGRIVHIGSGAGPNFVAQCSIERQKFFIDPTITVDQLNDLATNVAGASAKHAAAGTDPKSDFEALGVGSAAPYGFSKALVASYGMHVARAYPNLVVNVCTPGFIETDLTTPFADRRGVKPADMGMLAVDNGARCPMYLVLDDVPTPKGESWFYGSDSKRSPLHKYRSPGDPPFDGVVDLSSSL